MAVILALAGLALATLGGFLLLGPAVLIAAGVLLAAVGVFVDWEKAT